MKKTIYICITGNRDISNEQSIFIKKNIEDFLKKSLENKNFKEIIVLTTSLGDEDKKVLIILK